MINSNLKLNEQKWDLVKGNLKKSKSLPNWRWLGPQSKR